MSILESMNMTYHIRGLAFIQHFTAELSATVKNTEELFFETHECKNSATYFMVVPLKNAHIHTHSADLLTCNP